MQEMTEADRGTILLVEDEELLRSAISTMLRHNNYSVLEAADGTIAVELLQKFPEKIDLVLLDATLPGLSSRQVLEAARRVRAGMPVIVTSALDTGRVDAFFSGLNCDHFIQKPYRLATLLTLRGIFPAHGECQECS